MGTTLTRRDFVQRAAAYSLGFAGLRIGMGSGAFATGAVRDASAGFGALVPDPSGILDLPPGFTYSIISRINEVMDDGLIVPPAHDGMAAFDGPDGLTIVVRNHEVEPDDHGLGPFGERDELLTRIDKRAVFDPGRGKAIRGGTTTLVYDTRTQKLVGHFMSLAGTVRNCAGGPTPRGTWISCEETVVRADAQTHARDHGWCFEVPATATPSLARPEPIRAMGRFNHEACATDPRTGIVYMTEDRHDGLLYRFIPKDRDRLLEGGTLQALIVDGRPSLDTRNWDRARTVEPGRAMRCRWIDIEDVESPGDDLRFQGFQNGAARFARGEGMWLGNDGIYFCCTNGGREKLGQIFRLALPSSNAETESLELFVEPNDASVLENADNITVAPWGDLVVCEDGKPDQFLVGVTPEGKLYTLARNAISGSELAGATFSPDGSTLFLNIQSQGLTVAITGPWRRS